MTKRALIRAKANKANHKLMGLPADKKSREELAQRLRDLRQNAPLLPHEIEARKARWPHGNTTRVTEPLTMNELGARCRKVTGVTTVGFAKSAFSRWESANRMPSFWHMLNIAEALSMGRPVKDRITLEHITGIPMRAKVIKVSKKARQ